MDLFGIYVGIVEKNNDPEKLGRVKVRVPHAYGVIGSQVGAIPLDDMPWAIPMGLPAGGTSQSGGMDWLPEPGDQVCVQFLDGEPEKPVWSWLMQTQDQANGIAGTGIGGFPLHKYAKNPNGSQGGPERGALTRYGHTIEWNAGSIAMSTSKGYQAFFLDGIALDGQIQLRTPLGQFFTIDDQTLGGSLFLTDDLYVNLGSELNILCDNARLETISGGVLAVLADSLDVTAFGDISLSTDIGMNLSATSDMKLTTLANFSLNATANMDLTTAAAATIQYGTVLSFGLGSTEPFVLGTQLETFLTSLLLWLSTHTHGNGNLGSPTAPPIVPPVGVVQPLPSALISKTIFGK